MRKTRAKHTPESRAAAIAAFKAKKLAQREALKKLSKENVKLKVTVKRRENRRVRLQLFQPMYTEGRKSINALLARKAPENEILFTDEQEVKLAELVAMCTDENLLIKYPNWRMKALALGITQNEIYTWKNSTRFQQMLVEALRNNAMIATAASMPAQAQIASDPEHKQSTRAFGNLAKIGGVQAPREQKGGVGKTAITIESMILNLVHEASGGVKDAATGGPVKLGPGVIEEKAPPERKQPGSPRKAKK